MALFTAANVVSALAPDLAVLIAARVAAGAAAVLFAPTAGAAAGALVAPALRARALALSLGPLISATVIGVPVGTAVGTHLGWRVTMFLVVALGAAATALIAAALPEVPATAPPSLKSRAATITHPCVWPLLVLMLFLGIAALGLYTYLGTIPIASTGVCQDTLALYLMGWGLAAVAGNFGFARLIDSGRRPLPILVLILALLTAGLRPGPASASPPRARGGQGTYRDLAASSPSPSPPPSWPATSGTPGTSPALTGRQRRRAPPRYPAPPTHDAELR